MPKSINSIEAMSLAETVAHVTFDVAFMMAERKLVATGNGEDLIEHIYTAAAELEDSIQDRIAARQPFELLSESESVALQTIGILQAKQIIS